jgi:2-dehydropantoate 2-reductase
MKVAVIGAGAVGGTIAALLDRAGHSVEVTARGAQLAAVSAGGIHLSGAWGEHTANVIASTTLTQTPELVFLATKAQDAEAALLDSASMFVGIPLVVMQNGLEGLTNARRAAPRSHLVGGLALYAASLVAPGEIAVTTAGATYLGGEQMPALYVSSVLGAVMPVVVTENFDGAMWTKLVVNHINALPAITGLSAQEVIANPALRLMMTESMREAVRVGRARDIQFEKLQGLSGGLLALLERMPAAIGQIVPLLMKTRMGSRPNPGSTLQSIRRGQLTEIDYLNGAVVRLGLAAGVETPVSERLVEMVHEVERSGVFLTPKEVVSRR